MYSLIFFTNALRLLDARGLTKYELADQAGISISFLSDLTNGKANPSLKIMEAIAQALDEPLTALLESSDLDAESISILAANSPANSLLAGYVRASAILTEYQTFTIQQWDQANRKLISQPHRK